MQGHFGHITLAVPVVNPICLKQLKWIMKYICKKCKRITRQHRSTKNYRQAGSCFHCSAPPPSDDMFDVENIEDLEEVLQILTNMCQEDTDVLNIKGYHPKSYIMHYFPIIPTCVRPFLTNKDEPFEDDLTCQLSEIIKANNVVKNLFLGYEAYCKRLSTACFLHQYLLRQRKKKSRHSASGHAYEEISNILKRKGEYIRKH